ncbi:MAG: hydrogenase maturation factor [Lachnospiraceae bacterium]|nr:hydrogenase maturation factor [Lachnospiraceae bacterium]
MDIGKVPENILKRSVFKYIRHHRKEVLVYPGIGEDCCAVEAGDGEIMVFSTDPVTGAEKGAGRIAVHINANDIASSGAEPVGILTSIIMPPDANEASLKEIMKEISQACDELGIEVMGGHTEVSDIVKRTVINITCTGKVQKGRFIPAGGLSDGDDIVMTKWAGLEGTSIIAESKACILEKTLPKMLVETAASFKEYLSIVPEARIAAENGATAMHDITEGGIFGALWEIGEASGTGITADLHKIPIRQETIEVCEVFNINPYMLISSGSLLIGCPNGNQLAEELSRNGIPAAVIGRAVKGNARVVVNGGEIRYLGPAVSDELYKVV